MLPKLGYTTLKKASMKSIFYASIYYFTTHTITCTKTKNKEHKNAFSGIWTGDLWSVKQWWKLIYHATPPYPPRTSMKSTETTAPKYPFYESRRAKSISKWIISIYFRSLAKSQIQEQPLQQRRISSIEIDTHSHQMSFLGVHSVKGLHNFWQ